MRAERVAVRGADSCESDAGRDGLTRRARTCGQEKGGLGRCHGRLGGAMEGPCSLAGDRKSTRLNSSHGYISYAVFCLKKKKKTISTEPSRSTNTRADST